MSVKTESCIGVHVCMKRERQSGRAQDTSRVKLVS